MNYYLSLAALVPAVILFVRIYQLDRIEKEPRRLLGILLLSGALLALPAAHMVEPCMQLQVLPDGQVLIEIDMLGYDAEIRLDGLRILRRIEAS